MQGTLHLDVLDERSWEYLILLSIFLEQFDKELGHLGAGVGMVEHAVLFWIDLETQFLDHVLGHVAEWATSEQLWVGLTIADQVVQHVELSETDKSEAVLEHNLVKVVHVDIRSEEPLKDTLERRRA